MTNLFDLTGRTAVVTGTRKAWAVPWQWRWPRRAPIMERLGLKR